MRIADSVQSVVLVEGESDRQAVLATAEKLGRDLDAEGTQILAMGGATNVERYARDIAALDVAVFGLCDAPELRYFERVLDVEDIFVCHDDLEDELIRAMGVDEMIAFIESQGELKRFLTMQKQPAQRDRSIDHHLHRYCGIRSGRKVRYARGIVEWLSADLIPLTLRNLIAHL